MKKVYPVYVSGDMFLSPQFLFHICISCKMQFMFFLHLLLKIASIDQVVQILKICVLTKHEVEAFSWFVEIITVVG